MSKQKRARPEKFTKNKKLKKSHDTVLDDDEEINIRKLLDGMKEGVFFDDLKLFIRKAAQSPEITSLVISSGVKPLEIVEIIKLNEKAGSNVTSSLYEMLKMVVFQLSNEGSASQQNITDALKYLVRKNGTSIEMMLLSTVANDKIIIFELFTFCLRYQPEFASDILKNVAFFTKPDDVLEQMRALKSVNKGEDFSLVRKSFVVMMIEFISNTNCGRRIIQKSSLFQFFLEGLHNDTNETIREIIICLTEKVLLSSAFSKPEKLKIFSDEIIKNFLKIYELKSSENVEDKVILVHEFLIRLLTNKKQGIAFKGLTYQYQNQRQAHVIGSFKTVWMKEYPSKLVIEIIKACPDLMQNILSKIAVGLMPKVSAEWFMCANFTQVLLSSFDPEEMMKFLSVLEPKKISSNIIKFSIPQFVLQNLGENALTTQESLEVREKATQLLKIMLEKCCQYIRLLSKITTLKDYEQHRVKFDIINHIFTFFPSIETILNSLYRSINSQKRKTEEGEIVMKSQLKSTVNILLLLVEHFPSVIEKASSVIDFLDVLRPVYEQSGAAFNQDELEVEMNIAKIILLLKPELFTLKSELLHKLFYFLMKVYAGGEKRSFEARDLLISLLKNNYKVFGGNTIEIMVWLESLRKCNKPKMLQDSTTLFVKALHSNDDDDLPLISRILTMESNKLEKVAEFIERSVILLYFVHPEKRKSYSSLIKKSAASFCSEIYACFNDIEVISQMNSLEPFSKLQSAISNESDLGDVEIKDSNQLLLLTLQVIFNAIKLSKGDALSDEKIEILTNFVRKFHEEAKIIEDNCETNEEIYDDSTTERKSEKITELMASHIFNHQETLLSKFSIAKTHQISKFIENLTEIFKEVPNFDAMLSKYRSKILSELKESPKSIERFYKTFSNFKLDGDDCIKVLDLCVLNSQADIHLISLLLNRLIERKTTTFLAAEHCKFIETAYTDALEKESENVKEFEEAILNYLVTFPHNIRDFSTQIFEIACKKNHNFTIRRSFVSLNVLLLECKPECAAIIASQFANVRKEIAYPLLSTVIEKQIVPLDKIQAIFQKEYKSIILKALERPKKVAAIYRDFIETTLQLIDLGMSPNECFDFTQKKIKFDGSEVFQLKILQSIYSKAIASKDTEEAKEAVYVKFIDIWLNLFEQRTSSSLEGVCEYTKIMDEWIPKYRACKSEVDGETLSKVYKICLKNGLRNLEQIQLLHTIAQILNSVKVDADLAFEMFDLLITHSQFFSIAFSTKSSEINRKRDLFFIYAVLLKKNPQIASKKHVPILLSSYNATMLQSDQLILKLLRFYEHECNVDLWDYRPYFYGSAALQHFSNSENTDENSKAKNLGKTEADAIKLLESFEKSIVENTINNFPAHRKYDSIVDEIKIQPCEVANNNRIYDPAFYLPIFEMIVSTTSVNFSWQSIKNSLLELVLLSLSSEDETLRLIAAKILLKCRQQTETKGAQKEIWVRFYDNLQKGLNDFKEQTKQKGFPKMPTLTARLLAEFTKILSKKLDNSYNIVCNYLIMREKMDLTSIPEYLTLYQSNLPHHEEHALLLFSSIFYGIKDNLDVKVLTNGPILKLMLTSYKSPLSTRKVNYLILKTLDRLLTIIDSGGSGSKAMLDKYGIVMWLFHQSENLEAFEYDTIEMIISMIHNIVTAHKISDENSKNLLRCLLKLLPKLTKSKFSPDLLLKFLTTINKLQKFTFMKLKHIEMILNLAESHLPKEQTHFLNYLLKNPEISSWKVEIIHSHEQNSNAQKIYEEIKKIIAQTNPN